MFVITLSDIIGLSIVALVVVVMIVIVIYTIIAEKVKDRKEEKNEMRCRECVHYSDDFGGCVKMHSFKPGCKFKKRKEE